MTRRDAATTRPTLLRRLIQRRQTSLPPPGAPWALPPLLAERLDDLDRDLTALSGRLPPGVLDLAALQQTVAGLATQVSRAGREQFKANVLAEAQRDQIAEVLAQSRLAQTRREAEEATWPARCQEAEVAARLDVVQRLLPALDGLDEALRAGSAVLVRASVPAAEPHRRPMLARLLGNWGTTDPPPEVEQASALPEAMRAWLVGLEFVRQRLLDILAAEDVRPIETQGRPFDPHFQVAQEAVPASDDHPAGTVVADLRRGYRVGERVLRYAEVAVATDEPPIQRKEDKP